MLPLFARQVKYFLASVEKNEWRMHTEVSIEIYSNDIFWQKWEIFYTYRMMDEIWWLKYRKLILIYADMMILSSLLLKNIVTQINNIPNKYSDKLHNLHEWTTTYPNRLYILPPHPTSAIIQRYGEVQEWLNWHAWNACVAATSPRVRIPVSPPYQRQAACCHRSALLIRLLAWCVAILHIFVQIGLAEMFFDSLY